MYSVTVRPFYLFATSKREIKRQGPDIKSPHPREGGLEELEIVSKVTKQDSTGCSFYNSEQVKMWSL